MINISLRLLQHRHQEWIGIYFENNTAINTLIKKFGASWSQTKKCWYIPLNETYYKELTAGLKGIATINVAELKVALQKRKAEQTGSVLPGKKLSQSVITEKAISSSLNKANQEALKLLLEQLKLKAYSPSTIKTYRNEFLQLLQILKQKEVNDLTVADLKRYMVFAMEKQGINENTAHSRLNALKFYFEQVLGREKFFLEIPRPKKQLQLPKVLSEFELGKLFKAITNLKHKAIVFTAYSAGLRVSEAVNLKVTDIDSDRMTIFIAKAKGKKDRVVNLSPLLLDILRAYLRKENPKPLLYLFEGAKKGEPYSIRSAQQIFIDAKSKAGISKTIPFHGLRHSFATHLLEKGVDIKYIKEILGHFDIRTTERYLHIAKKDLINISSPLDDLREKGVL